MNRFREYAIAHTTAEEYPDLKARGAALEKDVNSMLEHGWQPIGGFTIDAQGNMYQAIGYCPCPINRPTWPLTPSEMAAAGIKL